MGFLLFLIGVKKVNFVPLIKASIIKRSGVGALAVPLRVLSLKKMTGDNLLF